MHKIFFIIILVSLFRLNSFSQEREQDTLLKRIELDLEISKQLTTIANYPEAYDKIWNVLIISDSLNNPKIKYQAYQNLSLLYSIFYKKTKAISAIDSMFIYANKSKVLEDPLIKSDLYYNAALTYRMNKNYIKAKDNLAVSEHILDSIHATFKQKMYVLTEKAHIYTLTGNYDESEKILTKILKQISEKHNYASIVYSMLGDLYAKKKENLKALAFYNKSLTIVSKQNKRVGLRVGLLEKVAIINYQLGNYKLAYQQANESKVLGNSLFGSQSTQNKQLFEIKDSYRNTLVKNNKIKKEHELKLIKAEKEKLNLQLLFSILLFVITVVVSFFGIRLTRKKLVVEKQLVAQRANAELEIKKKELAVTALQLIEKDKLLEEIKKGLEEIKRDKDDTFVEQIKSTIKVNSAKTWEEFETRFIQVNTSFYESLGKKHSNLSRNELKLCALVKLNFSTKEMSQLLGVSADSANKARYRLRKKLGLKRDDNLVTYINSI